MCPPELFDGLIWLADRGLAVTTVEPRARAGRHRSAAHAGFPAAEVLTRSLQDWRPNEAGFPPRDGVVVNSLHWTDPDVQYA